MAVPSIIMDKELQKLGNTFVRHGYQIRIVGGAVRDVVMGNEPNDIDLCTTATPDEMLALAEAEGLRVIPTGLQHGTVTFVVGGESYEITTLRIDTETDGRHAQVEFTTDFRQDAARRDFTINAMSMDLNGEIYDYFDGRKDITNKIIRFVGDAHERIHEDYLRALRMFRFMARYDFTYQGPDLNQTWIRTGMEGLSGERIWAEIKKIIESKHANGAIRAMNSSFLFPVIGDCLWMNIEQSIHEFFLVFREGPGVTDEMREIATAMFFAAIVGIEASDHFIKMFAMSSRERKAIEFYNHVSVRNGDHLMHWDFWPHAMEANGHDRGMIFVSKMLLDVNLRFGVTTLSLAQMFSMKAPTVPFSVTGADLIKRGVKPGPQMGVILRGLKAKWISMDGKISTDELLAMFDRNGGPNMVLGTITFFDIKGETPAWWFAENIKAAREQKDKIVEALEDDQVETAFLSFGPFQSEELVIFFKDHNQAIKCKLSIPELATLTI